ncbi:ScbA/BarX family gamma-butyrolactone biosynthesis protein [Streptomyces tateyamensis]|nr:ScbA/BarX family gamma-butyrolactone biosynthesis protein [Streptomyces tateyamensis]
MTAARGIPATDELDFFATLDRRLLHRRAISEVFLTSMVPTSRDGFLAGAQLPSSHTYFTDHQQERRTLDPLLLLEACRQAETFAAHVLHEVPLDAKFVLRSWSWQQIGQAPELPAGPAELAIRATTSNPQVRDGMVRGLDYDMDLWLGGAPLGSVQLRASYLPAAIYPGIRRHGRGSNPPLSDGAVVQPTTQALAPHQVGRLRPENVVLAGLREEETGTAADLLVPVANPSMFDHPLDHVPGMVAMEAARQLALATTNDRRGSLSRTQVTSLHGEFGRYLELDAPITLHAAPTIGQPELIQVSLRQQGVEAAAIRVGLSAADAVTGSRS